MAERHVARDCVGCIYHKIVTEYHAAAMTIFLIHKCIREGGNIQAPTEQWHGLTFNLKAPMLGTCSHKGD
jgi:hypothetical protein